MTPNEKTQPIQGIKWPTGALVAAGSLWPANKAVVTGSRWWSVLVNYRFTWLDCKE